MSARGLRFLFALACAACAAAGPASAGRLGAQLRYWSFADGNDLRDPIVYGVAGPVHVQLEYWDVLRGEDQFRPEVGLHVRDRRRSSYTLQWRHERRAERAWLGTEQVLDHGLVGRAEVSPIFGDDRTLLVWDVGGDRYWSDYNFAGATFVRDPREGGLWAVPMRARFATAANDWVQVTFAPASRRTLGWALDGRWRLLRAGVERNSRFDFTTRDNVIFTLGLEADFPGPVR